MREQPTTIYCATETTYRKVLDLLSPKAEPPVFYLWTVCKCLPDDWHGNRDCPAHGGV